MNPSQTKREINRQYWFVRIEAWKQSGLTQKAFCEQRKRLANYVYLVLAGFAMMPSPSIDLSRANYDFELIQKSNQPPALV